MKFNDFKTSVGMQFSEMAKGELFLVDVDKDTMWETYLKSFPEGTNPIFRERTEHDCQCCRQFIRGGGNVVAITDDLELVSIWDIEIGGHYQVVADALSDLMKSRAVTGIFKYFQKNLGTDHNHEMGEDDKIRRWDHFHFRLPPRFVSSGVGNPHVKSREEKELLQRGLAEITLESLNTVIELIEQDSIYRGEEYLDIVEDFKILKVDSDAILANKYDLYLWNISAEIGPKGRIKNSVIGTLLIDISEDMELDQAVYRFNHKMDPERFKRPTAVATKGMIKKAEEKVKELGYIDSLARRHAEMDDITINNVLFANRDAKQAMNVFDEMIAETPVNIKKLQKVEEISVDTFVNEILPKAENVEVYFENQHQNNLMSLIAPWNPEGENMLKWGNNFSWAYNGEVADSIKERVRAAGGNVDAVLRCSLSWFNYDDLDIHVEEPGRNGKHIYYNNKRNISTSGFLDVDMNVQSGGSRKAVENIVWTNKSKMLEGRYTVYINQYTKRENKDFGFVLEMEYEGKVWTFRYDKPQNPGSNVDTVVFDLSKKDGIKIVRAVKSDDLAQEMWGINTTQFHKASVIMNSPNHWDGEKTGNRHLFFILEGCRNDQPVRGFFNEFLNEKLTPHRKVFEMLGSKMKAEVEEKQLSGLGFSSTRRSGVICKVTGSFTRTVKINF